ncbi:HAD family hydrolase [Mesorhizobium sp. Z1-4]|uniref:HAD family hydrolase n=1 Tax=Mesorhizobium sp. Z1-4 TaxID=2448478 RepID=UPI000FDAC3C4|nr:HAD family hydrolase [Mesorhizobium sp. Z1-4]
MPAIRGLLFDKDGTLVDFEATWSAVARAMALDAAEGDAARAREFLTLAGFDERSGSFVADSVFAAGTNEDVVRLWHPALEGQPLADRVRYYDARTSVAGAASAVPVAGVLPALSDLHNAGYLLGVATNDSADGAARTLEALGVAELFSAALGYDSVTNPKPAPDMIHRFAQLNGIEAPEIAFVGDNGHDMAAGRAAGCGLVVGVLSGTGTRETLASLADVVLASVAELPALLAGR